MPAITPQPASASTKARATIAELLEERNALIMSFPLGRAAETLSDSAPISGAPTVSAGKNAMSKDAGLDHDKEAGHAADTSIESASSSASSALSPEYAAEVLAAARKVVKQHISLLHEYNEMRDIGYGLLGMIADQRGVRLVDVMEEFGVGPGD